MIDEMMQRLLGFVQLLNKTLGKEKAQSGLDSGCGLLVMLINVQDSCKLEVAQSFLVLTLWEIALLLHFLFFLAHP